jgi:hypothetical protein
VNIIDFGETLYATAPTPTAEQYAAAHAYVTRMAPDLLDAIFGGAA